MSRVIECPDCGWQSSSQGSPWTVLAAHKPHCGKGWNAAPLREVPMSNGKGTKRRRDLRDLDPQFLAAEIEQAWPAYLGTFHRRNASIGAAIFDADDTEAELRLLLTEAATRFDGRGRFARWACAKQRQDLLDIRRRQVGRRIADAELAISRGDDHALAADVATVHAIRKPLSIDALNSDGLALADIVADNPQPITTTTKETPMEKPTMPAPETLLEHDNRRVAKAAERVLAAQEALREAWEADAGEGDAMRRYRKIPVEVEARQLLSNNDLSVAAWCGGHLSTDGLVIPTLEGDMLARRGDWIIKGVHGEFYPCKPDIFVKTYEMVEAMPDAGCQP